MSGESWEGWTNRSTWALMLHINNDQAFQHWAHSLVGGSEGELEIAEMLEEIFRDAYLQLIDGQHLLTALFQDLDPTLDINWREVANALIDDVDAIYGEEAG